MHTIETAKAKILELKVESLLQDVRLLKIWVHGLEPRAYPDIMEESEKGVPSCDN